MDGKELKGCGLKGGASASQRGDAAHIRQKDDNSGKQILNKGERDFVNKVVHDPSLKHRPKFDPTLNDLKKRHGT